MHDLHGAIGACLKRMPTKYVHLSLELKLHVELTINRSIYSYSLVLRLKYS